VLAAAVLWLHSWLRWVVLATGATLLARAAAGLLRGRAWSAWDRRAAVAFLSALDTQVLLGLSLFFVLSPLTPRSVADLRAFMPVAPLRFFAVEHPTAMLVGLIAAHAGWAFARRAPTDRARHRRILVGVGVAMLAFAVGIPWPWLPYGRALVRGF
jgi:hypothetical protein